VGCRFGEEALRGETWQGIDLQQVRLVRLLLDHDINSRQVARADDLICRACQFAASFDHILG